MRAIIALSIFVIGIIVGIYLGVWVMFIGGIAQIIEGLQVNPINAIMIAKGIAKFFFSGLVGWVSFLLCAFSAGIIARI